MSMPVPRPVRRVSTPLDGLLRVHRCAFHDLLVDGVQGRRLRVGDRDVVDFATSAYLGLDVDLTDEDVARARAFGLRNGWSRATGTTALARGLERDLAAALGLDEARLATSAALVNYSAFGAFERLFPIAIYDRDAHATLKQGLCAAYAAAARHSFPNNDLDALAALLARLPSDVPKLVAVDGVYSMKGTAAPVAALAELCARHRAVLFVDDVHAFGVLGERGLGSIEAVPAELRRHVIVLGSFAKSCSNPVAFVAYAREHWLAVEAIDGLNYSGPPSNVHVAACARHLARFDALAPRRARVRELSERLHRFCLVRGYATLSEAGSPILAVRVVDEHAEEAARGLFDGGVVGKLAVYPIVQRGDEVVRFTLTAGHTAADCARLERALDGVAGLLGGDR